MSNKVHKIDASGKILGRLATEIATLLQGKHRPDFTPSVDKGEKVIVTNTSKIRVTGKKMEQKKYYRHSGYMGGLTEIKYKQLFKKDPNKILRTAVYGMLPKNKLRDKRIKKLKLYAQDQKEN